MDQFTNQSTFKYALITYYFAYNCGSVLQAYATQQVLHKIAADMNMINYRKLPYE